MNSNNICYLFFLLCAALITGQAIAATSDYDGNWNGLISCTAHANDPKQGPFTRNNIYAISDGRISASYKTTGGKNTLTTDGTVTNGNAIMTINGTNGTAKWAFNFNGYAPSAEKIVFSGSMVEQGAKQRDCTMEFTASEPAANSLVARNKNAQLAQAAKEKADSEAALAKAKEAALAQAKADPQAQSAACHALAASPTDPERKGVGVPYAKLDGLRASVACQIAVQQLPKDGQLWFQYGRALEKANRVAEAFVAYQTAASLDNSGAMNNLGELYRDGKGVGRNLYMAEILFRNASPMGAYPEAIQNLETLVKAKPPASTRIIPKQFRGKFSLPNQTCQKTQENSKDLGGAFLGFEVNADEMHEYNGLSCVVLGLNIANGQQASVALMCGRGSPFSFLVNAMLSPSALRFEATDSIEGGISVRCAD